MPYSGLDTSNDSRIVINEEEGTLAGIEGANGQEVL